MAAPERGELLPTEVRSEHNAEDQQLLKGIVAEVDRYRSMDRLIPSSHNIVTIAALEASPHSVSVCYTITEYFPSFIWFSVSQISSQIIRQSSSLLLGTVRFYQPVKCCLYSVQRWKLYTCADCRLRRTLPH